MLTLLAEGGSLPGGYGAALVQTLLALAAVCVLAWILLRWAARRGFGTTFGSGRIQVLERVALDPRRSLYLVRIGDRVLLVGAADGGGLRTLAELDPRELPERPDPGTGRGTFADVLRRLGERKG